MKAIPTEGTYLVWLDFKGTGIDATKLDDLMINKARLWLDSGSIFGKTGAGFGSASADKFLSESVRILAERLTQSELVPRLS